MGNCLCSTKCTGGRKKKKLKLSIRNSAISKKLKCATYHAILVSLLWHHRAGCVSIFPIGACACSPAASHRNPSLQNPTSRLPDPANLKFIASNLGMQSRQLHSCTFLSVVEGHLVDHVVGQCLAAVLVTVGVHQLRNGNVGHPQGLSFCVTLKR